MRLLVSSALLLFALIASGQQIVNTGHHRTAAASGCVPPATNAANDWTPVSNGGGTGNPGMTDSVSSNTASQAVSLIAPSYSASGGPNSTPILTFNGSTDYLNLTSSVPDNWATYSGYFVFEAGGSTGGAFLGGVNSASYWEAVYGGSTFSFYINGGGFIENNTTSLPSTGSTWVTVAFQWNPSSGAYTVWRMSGGTATVIGSGTNVQTPDTTSPFVQIGKVGGGSSYYTGPIAEMALYNGTINSSTLATYSSCKFGI